LLIVFGHSLPFETYLNSMEAEHELEGLSGNNLPLRVLIAGITWQSIAYITRLWIHVNPHLYKN